MKAQIYHDDCLNRLAELPENSVDAVVTDPPYGLPGGFMGLAWDRFKGREDVAFGYYLAGLIDGEGCFRSKRHERGTHSCAFTMRLRVDDRAILDRARRELGIGTISRMEERGPSRPCITWSVQSREDCERLVGFLRRFPLRAKKRVDFEGWAEAVGEWIGRPRGGRWHGAADQTRAATLKARIEAAREYTEIPWSGHPFQDWCREWAREVLRVLKPGGHLLAFGGTRTYHRMACAVEDAGFEIRDMMQWLYGQGMSHGLNVSKALDKAAGVERGSDYQPNYLNTTHGKGLGGGRTTKEDPPATDDAKTWDGWHTNLKPACEPLVLARKPISEATIAANVLRWSTGAINVDGARIGTSARFNPPAGNKPGGSSLNLSAVGMPQDVDGREAIGRFPSNVLLDEDVATALDYRAGEEVSRCFYVAKPSGSERNHGCTNRHATVKPVTLMRYLVRLVCPIGGTVLDPFMGSGTTGVACAEEYVSFIGIEQDAESFATAQDRIRKSEEQGKLF